jgi:hypothetical protein
MDSPLAPVIGRLVDETGGNEPLSGVAASARFRPEEADNPDIARNLAAAFLIVLSGPGHRLFEPARDYLRRFRKDRAWGKTASFFWNGVRRIGDEVSSVSGSDRSFATALDKAREWSLRPGTAWDDAARQQIWSLFFPEGAECLGSLQEQIARIRARRHVRITSLNPEPVTDPAREILFMANLLVTLPHDKTDPDALSHSPSLIRELKEILHEKQRYWYDHPIQIGVANDNNEAIYGLRGLDRAMAYEKKQGLMGPDDQAVCLLSVSVTHDGLHRIVKDYLSEVYAATDPSPHLKVYLFSEVDAGRILDEVLLPAAKSCLNDPDPGLLRRVFGVDGEYGRHYSFLKALSAYWQVMIDPRIKGSFKIDLDQVFDQEALAAETGASALGHFLTPLWGARGVDAEGRAVDLGMMAGALVNEKDITRGLFTPDVPMPDPIPRGEAVVFFSQLPQALSTRAEMMARYAGGDPDGRTTCLQRIHVTGGTCAALVKSIRRHRPFTPGFVGRAEDQAYILSCLFRDPEPNLRYVHKPGLIMRHDKASFAAQAIEGARTGKYVGDLVRILLFSSYARALPWPLRETKDAIDPFTGCFVSKIPSTVVYLRLAIRLLEVFAPNAPDGHEQGLKLLSLAVDRLEGHMRELEASTSPIKETCLADERGWEMFHDLLDHLEAGLARGDQTAVSLRRKALELVAGCRVRKGSPMA